MWIKLLAGIVALSLLVSVLSIEVGAVAAVSTQPATEEAVVATLDAYRTYLQTHSGAPRPNQRVEVDITRYRADGSDVTLTENVGGRLGSQLITGDVGMVEWTVTVPESGLYNIGVEYYTSDDNGSYIVRKLLIDGVVPFEEATALRFSRVFVNETEIITKENGDQVRPMQVEQAGWISAFLKDSTGMVNAPYSFYFAAGEHTLALESIREDMTVGGIYLYQVESVSAYAAYPQDRPDNAAAVQPFRIQGETAVRKSDATLYPITDNSSYNTDPSDPMHQLVNTIGGNHWQTPGQWVEWEFTVPESGYYHIAVKGRQNVAVEQPSYRYITVDGSLPFTEMEAVRFDYTTGWQLKVLGDETPYRIYLEAGQTHTLRMEATLGEFQQLIHQVSDSITALNAAYRSILMEVGQSADVNRDYQLDKTIPETLDLLQEQGRLLKSYYDAYVTITGSSGSQAQTLLNMSKQAKLMAEKPYRIPKLLSDFSNNISALGTWLTTTRSQPLEIDYLELVGTSGSFTPVENNFLRSLVFAFMQFIASFRTDYSVVSAEEGQESLVVWMNQGQDQATTLSHMTSNYFTTRTGIPVTVQLVPAGTVLTASLAGKGPDVHLNIDQATPMNYAIRGAVQDLSTFPGYKDVAARFKESALRPFGFDGKVYALPETQSFPVLFYRKDIMEEMKLAVPETWEDVQAMLTVLQKKNLSFGLPADFTTYASLLFQNGGSLYNSHYTASTINEKVGIEAFERWTGFYTDYSLSMQYDFLNRFRSGEMPIAIADYGVYNSLSVFAPELEGAWAFSVVPGTRRPDGTVDHTVASAVTGSILMRDAKQPDNAWKFLEWWTSAEIQDLYGRELESIMGTAGRYQTANVESIYNIPWNTRDFQVLLSQLELTRGVDEIPGSYMTARFLNFALVKVAVSGAEDPGQVLLNTVRQINSEITAKRYEFGLDTREG